MNTNSSALNNEICVDFTYSINPWGDGKFPTSSVNMAVLFYGCFMAVLTWLYLGHFAHRQFFAEHKEKLESISAIEKTEYQKKIKKVRG